MSARSYLSIGDVLTLLRQEFPDVTISKIRFLESQGLVNPERTPSGYRKFYEHDVERLRWVLRQQREHFLPLKVIKGRLDGDAGVLMYRGYPIEQLAEDSDHLETAYLILFGELPTKTELVGWVDEITHHTFVHENMKQLMEAFRYDAHPMGMFISLATSSAVGSWPNSGRATTCGLF